MIRLSRVGVVHGAFVVFAVALVGRSAWVQLGQTEQWRSKARGQQTVTADVPAPRGAILDAEGTVLVESRALVRLDIAPTEVRSMPALAKALRRIEVPASFVARATDRNRKWVELPGRFLSTDVQDLVAMRGVHPRPVLERVPPATDGLRRLLGVMDGDGKALGGIEAALDDVLQGTAGRSVLVKTGRGGRVNSPEEGYEAPTPGRTVVLTLHQGLQDIAERALADAIEQLNARGGDIVMLDPRSGEIRALASRRAQADASGATALTEPYEPGSTLKPFIAAALLERGRVRLTDSVNTYNGTYTVNGRTITDIHRAKAMSFADVIRFSSNIGIVQFAERLSAREQYETLRDAGFGMTTGAPYPSESQGRLRPPQEWSRQSAASLSMGYEIAVTPLQLALAYAAIANGGELLEPVLVKELRTPDGQVTFKAERRVARRIMSPETARSVRDLLRDVVASGTATSADLATVEVAGKSGTARRVAANGRGYEEGAYTASFVGLFPAEDPQLVILVKLDNPDGAYYGGRTAAPVTKVVLTAVIAARDAALDPRGIKAVPTRTTEKKRAEGAAEVAAFEAAERAEPVEETSAPFVIELGAELPARRAARASRAVPDVRGWPTRRAVRELHRAGFRVSVVRADEPTGTSPGHGTLLPAGAMVQLVSRQ